MKAIDIPDRFQKYWGLDADPGDINDIPVNAPGTPGYASLDIGFPHITSVPLGSGGIPPRIQDFNGIYQIITQNIQWSSNAGAPFTYDATFSTAIGGYPQGAVLASTSQLGAYWLSVVDDNTVDPEGGVSANWAFIYGPLFFGTDTGTKNAGAITLKPVPASLANLTSRPIVVQKIATAQDGNYTLNPNGLGNTPVILPNGSQIPPGTLPASSLFLVCLDANGNFELLSGAGASSGRTVLTGNTDFYISTTGSDANNGTSSGTPWLTFQHAWNVLTQNYDLAGFNATVHAADGTYSAGAIFSGVPTLGSGKIIFQSTSGTATACIVSVASGNCFTGALAASVTINNIKLISTTGAGIFAGSKSNIEIAGVNFGACGTYHIFTDEQARVNLAGDYAISGAAANHWNSQSLGEIHLGTSSITITLSGTPAFSNAFARASNNGLVVLNSLPTFSGSATGVRYSATFNGVINTSSGNTSFLPGGSAGTTATGGQYN